MRVEPHLARLRHSWSSSAVKHGQDEIERSRDFDCAQSDLDKLDHRKGLISTSSIIGNA